MSVIKTEWKMAGEKEYKAALTDINRDLNVLNSEMKKVSAVYADNAHSVEALSAKQSVLDRELDAQRQKVEATRAALESAAAAYGEGDRRVSSWQIKLNNAEAQLAKTEQAVNRNREAMEEASKATGEATDATGKYAEAQEGAAEGGNAFGDIINSLAGKLGVQLPSGLNEAAGGLKSFTGVSATAASTIGLVAAAVIAVEDALIGTTKAAAEFADNINTLTVTSGIAADQLQVYQYAAELLDVSVETITDAQKQLVAQMRSASEGSAAQVAAFEKLGVAFKNVEDGSLRPTYDVFLDVIDALGQVNNATERDATAMVLFGESAQRLNPLILQGAGALEALAEEAHDVGYVLTNEQLSALGKVSDAYDRLDKTTEAAKNQIGAEFAPSLEIATDNVANFVKTAGDAFQRTGLTSSFASLLSSVSGLLDPLGGLLTIMSGPLKTVTKWFAETIAGITDALNASIGVFTLIPELFRGNSLSSTRLATALGLGSTPSARGSLYQSERGNYYDYATGKYYRPGEINYDNYQIDVASGSFSGSYAEYTEKMRGAYGWNAGGTPNWRGGLTWVGENGPELVNLPRGSTVYTAQESRMTGGDTFKITISAKDVREFNDIVEMAQTARMRARKVTG